MKTKQSSKKFKKNYNHKNMQVLEKTFSVCIIASKFKIKLNIKHRTNEIISMLIKHE